MVWGKKNMSQYDIADADRDPTVKSLYCENTDIC